MRISQKVNAASRQPRVTGEPGDRRRPAGMSPGQAERVALPRTDPSPRPQRGRAGPGPSRECPGAISVASGRNRGQGSAPSRPGPGVAAEAQAAPSSPHVPPGPASARPGASWHCPLAARAAPAVPAPSQEAPALSELFQHYSSPVPVCARTVPRQFQTVPALSQMFQHCLEQCQGSSSLTQLCASTVPGCPSTIATVPILYPTLSSQRPNCPSTARP